MNDDTKQDLPVEAAPDGELLQFAFQLAGGCPHCSMKAQIALISSQLECKLMASLHDDERWLDPRIIITGAIQGLLNLDEQEAEAFAELGDEPAGEPTVLPIHRTH